MEALDEACKRLDVVVHSGSKLVPAFHRNEAGEYKGPSEIAAILKGVAILFDTGGHSAFSSLDSTLHNELHGNR